MIKVLGKSLVVTLVTMGVMYVARQFASTDMYITDIGWLFGSLVTALGTLYGIMSAFIVFEVWNKYNKTSELIDKEALGLEQLSNLTHYLRDQKLSLAMTKGITNYANLIVQSKLKSLLGGSRQEKIEDAFSRIGEVIKNIKFDDDHDAIVFNH